MHLPTPIELKRKLPLSDTAAAFVASARKELINIFEGRDKRLLIIAGPCSIHNVEEGLLFAKKFKTLAQEVQDRCFLVMRAYVEKPRTRDGWRGLVHDPHLNNSHDISYGMTLSRQFLIDLANLGVPAATEFLTPHLAPYIEDCITWGCIGARTSSSQIHRMLASHLPMPIGFKNSVDGNIDCAIHGVELARLGHIFMHIDDSGKLHRIKSSGNLHTHVVLRGSLMGPNYDEKTVLETIEKLRSQELPPKILIDCSHDNSSSRYFRQKEVFQSILMQIEGGNQQILGMMLESNLEEGKQMFPPSQMGISVTDSCLEFSAMAELISSVSSSISMSLTHS